MNTQLRKGILEMCILYVISENEMYGYDIMKKINQYFPDVNESTLYSILRRLNIDGSTETYFGEVSNGPKRKYYRITNQGFEYLQDSILGWKNISKIVEDMGIK